MNTVKLYDADAYIRDFTARVMSVEKIEDESSEYNGCFAVILDKTAFFPEEGGQYADSGVIGGANVLYVNEIGGVITHITDRAVAENTAADCSIDWQKRFARMQNHSGEHIVSGLVHKKFGLNNVGFHLNDSEVTIDFDGVITSDGLAEIEYLANQAVFEDVKITASYPDQGTLSNLDYRSKLALTQEVRVVEIEGYDLCACCAPHVSSTGQIGIIKFLDCINYKGGIRLKMVCGFYALADYKEKYSQIAHIANALSVKQCDTAAAFDKMSADYENLRRKISALNKKLAEMTADTLSPTDKNICLIFEKTENINSYRNLVNRAVTLCGGMCALFAGDDKDGYSYIIASQNLDMKGEAPKINNALGGKGGGSDKMICGSVSATEADIRRYFE